MSLKMVRLHNGVSMPQFGLGVFRLHDGPQVENAVLHAFKVGYRRLTLLLMAMKMELEMPFTAVVSKGKMSSLRQKFGIPSGYEQTKQAFLKVWRVYN